QGCLCLVDDGGKSRFVMHRQIGQHTAIKTNIGLAQTGNQTAVAQTAGTGRGVDTHDPERAELTLALTTVTIGVLTGLDDGLFRDAEHARTSTVITFGLLENFLVTAAGGHTTFNTSHETFLSSKID